jgi:APA family basic amino acid/polyamine antiporter
MMNEATPSLARRLGLFTTTSIIVGAVIGSGIFKKPATMAAELGSPEILLLVWLVAGIITLFGALTNAEVAGMISETGGQYVFFQSMYGDVVAYLYGWAVFIVIQTGSIAAITYVFAEYAQFFFTLPQLSAEVVEYGKVTLPLLGTLSLLDNFGVKLLTAGVITGLTAINYAGLVFGGAVQNIFTVLKVAALMLLVGAGFLWSGGSWANLATDSLVIKPASGSMFVAFFAALSGAFWAYDGWNNITYIAGEV